MQPDGPMSDSPPLDPAAPAPDAAGPAAVGWAGAPLRSTLAWLSVPALLAVAILALDLQLPRPVLYAVAGAFGLLLLSRAFRDPELVLAAFVLYIPLKKMFVVPIAPGLNGTNGLEALMLLAWVVRASREGRPLLVTMPGSRLVGWWGAFALLSVVTAGFRIGFGTVLSSNGADLKLLLDHFIVFFAFLHLVRDGAMARRVVVYMMVGAVVVLGLGVREWLDKRWLSSIEKARLLGPQLQPNDYGAFLVYSAGPFLALLLTQMRRVRAWLVAPYLVVLAKMLLATFSRGAFVGVAVAGVAAGWLRGKWFLLGMGLLGAGLIAAMPQLIPESLAARMGQTTSTAGYEEELDASSQTRLVLWKAAVDMTLESPLLGKGFKMFPRLKGQYTEMDVHESDNHNMFLYVASQMGVPALIVFLWLLWRTYALGAGVYRSAGDGFGRAIGMGGAAMVPGLVAVNMFGSRMVDIGVNAYFWVYLAVLAHLWREIEGEQGPAGAGGGP